MKKKLSIMILSVILTTNLIGGSNVFAQPIQKNTPTVASVSKEFNLKDATTIPEGVTPVIVNSPQELQANLQKVKGDIDKSNKAPTTVINEVAPTTNAINSLMYTSSSITTKYITSKLNIGNYISFFSVWGTLTIEGYSYYRSILSIGGYNCGLTGYTYGFALFGPQTTKRLYNSNTSASITGSASLDYYVLVSGIGKIYSRPITHTVSYNLY